jgi:Pyruvate/2-oxoacid:ferredoxin oxidoreductase gamma subunit
MSVSCAVTVEGAKRVSVCWVGAAADGSQLMEKNLKLQTGREGNYESKNSNRPSEMIYGGSFGQVVVSRLVQKAIEWWRCKTRH